MTSVVSDPPIERFYRLIDRDFLKMNKSDQLNFVKSLVESSSSQWDWLNSLTVIDRLEGLTHLKNCRHLSTDVRVAAMASFRQLEPQRKRKATPPISVLQLVELSNRLPIQWNLDEYPASSSIAGPQIMVKRERRDSGAFGNPPSPSDHSLVSREMEDVNSTENNQVSKMLTSSQLTSSQADQIDFQSPQFYQTVDWNAAAVDEDFMNRLLAKGLSTSVSHSGASRFCTEALIPWVNSHAALLSSRTLLANLTQSCSAHPRAMQHAFCVPLLRSLANGNQADLLSALLLAVDRDFGHDCLAAAFHPDPGQQQLSWNPRVSHLLLGLIQAGSNSPFRGDLVASVIKALAQAPGEPPTSSPDDITVCFKLLTRFQSQCVEQPGVLVCLQQIADRATTKNLMLKSLQRKIKQFMKNHQ